MGYTTVSEKNQVLFSPTKIGNVRLKNRVLMAPMETNMPSMNGEVNPHLIQYYKERAEGGVGGIIIEFTCVDSPVGKGTETQLILDKNGYIPGHTYLVEEIQKNDCKVFLQLHHAGRQTNHSITGTQPVAPSPIPCKVMKAEPRELETDEIAEIVLKFIKAARRAKLAGYDGIELHAAHGYLLGSFLSPYTNHRSDQYGGSTENRTRVIREIIEGIKQKVDKDFPIIVRFSADEFVDGGMTINESIEVGKLLESYGADALHVTTGMFESNEKNIDPMSAPQGWRLNLANGIKEVVSIPVIGVGVIREPGYANQAIQDGKVDLIAIGRALIADPNWPNKAKANDDQNINRCTSCGYCTERLGQHKSIRCSVNPRAGRETLLPQLSKVEHPNKKVHVIGAGSTGLYAAILAAERGFDVHLYEKKKSLGGLLDVASAAPNKEKWQWFKEYLIHRLDQFPNLILSLNHNFQKSDLGSVEGDYILDCTGMIPKEENSFCNIKPTLWDVTDVLEDKKKITGKNILVLGSRGAGLEVAHYLAEQTNNVLIIARSDRRANGLNIDPINRRDLLQELKKLSVSILNNTDLDVTSDGELVFFNTHTKKPVEINMEPDIIVTARGFHSNQELGETGELRKVGGSKQPGKILSNIYNAYLEISKLS